MNLSGTPDFAFEPLDQHDRPGFSCGIPELDRYLQSQAGQDARRRVAAPFVMAKPDGTILGYYTLSAYSVRLAELPAGFSGKLARYPLLPATRLGRLAVSERHQGMKFGRLLLMDALRRSWRNPSEVASVGVVAEALNESARAFYLHHEFLPLERHSHRLFIAMKTIARLFASQ